MDFGLFAGCCGWWKAGFGGWVGIDWCCTVAAAAPDEEEYGRGTDPEDTHDNADGDYDDYIGRGLEIFVVFTVAVFAFVSCLETGEY